MYPALTALNGSAFASGGAGELLDRQEVNQIFFTDDQAVNDATLQLAWTCWKSFGGASSRGWEKNGRIEERDDRRPTV